MLKQTLIVHSNKLTVHPEILYKTNGFFLHRLHVIKLLNPATLFPRFRRVWERFASALSFTGQAGRRYMEAGSPFKFVSSSSFADPTLVHRWLLPIVARGRERVLSHRVERPPASIQRLRDVTTPKLRPFDRTRCRKARPERGRSGQGSGPGGRQVVPQSQGDLAFPS